MWLITGLLFCRGGSASLRERWIAWGLSPFSERRWAALGIGLPSSFIHLVFFYQDLNEYPLAEKANYWSLGHPPVLAWSWHVPMKSVVFIAAFSVRPGFGRILRVC